MMSTKHVLAAAVLVSLAACISAPATSKTAEPQFAAGPVSPASSGLRVEGNRLFLPVQVQGVETEALLDSGAEITVVTPEFAERTGLLAFGEQTARGTGAGTARVQFAGDVMIETSVANLERRMVAIMDLTDVSERLIGRPLTVILGREFFDAGRYVLDIEAGMLGIATEAPPEAPLALTEAHGIMQMPVRVNGQDVLADFDLGNGSEVLLSATFAEALGLLQGDTVLGSKAGGGIGGEVERTLVHIDLLEIGPLSLRDVVAAVSPGSDGADMNVGVSVLRHFRMVIDFPEGALWLEARE